MSKSIFTIIIATIVFISVGVVGAQTLDQTYVNMYNPLLNGATCSDVTLNSAIADGASATKSVYLTKTDRSKVSCTWNLLSNVTMDNTRTLSIPRGVTVNLNPGVTLTACIDAGDYEIFSGSGAVLIPSGCTSSVKANWWPKTPDGLSKADTTAVNSGVPMILSSNTWNITSNTTINSTYSINKGGILNISNGVTVTSNTCPAIGLYKAFNLSGTGSIVTTCATVHPEWWGFICDGVTNNGDILNKTADGLPSYGGNIRLPSSSLTGYCKYDTKFLITKKISLTGTGGGNSNSGFWSHTVLHYTGSDVAIELSGKPTVGSNLEGFELQHTGTAVTGIKSSLSSHQRFTDISIHGNTAGFVKFTGPAIDVGSDDIVVSAIFDHVSVRDAGPIGLRLTRTNAATIIDSNFLHHSLCNLDLGTDGRVKDTSIYSSRFETSRSTYTEAVAICVVDVEGLWIDRSHFELGNGANAAVEVKSTATQAEHLFITNNFINILDTASVPDGDSIIRFDKSATYAIVRGNRVSITGSGTVGAAYLVNVPNSGGAFHVVIEDNELNGVGAIDLPGNVNGEVQIKNNYGLGNSTKTFESINVWCIDATVVGSVTSGESVLATCTIPAYTMYRADVTGFWLNATGSTANNGNNKRIRVRGNSLTGDILWDTGNVVTNTGTWFVTCNYVRSSTTGARGACHGGVGVAGSSGSSFTAGKSWTVSSADWNSNQDIVITGEAATANSDVSIGSISMSVMR